MQSRLLLLLLAGVLLGTGLFVALAQERPEPGAQVAAIAALQPPVEPDPVPGSRSHTEVTPTPTPQPQPDPEPEVEPHADEDPVLAARLSGLLVDAALPPDARLGISVRDAGGRRLYDHHGDVPLMPASTQKLVSAAGALAGFGADHRFTTEVYASAPPAPDGTLAGDLVLRGGGDPSLATPRFAGVNPQRPRTPLESLADQVVAAGVRHVTGNVVGDATVLPHEPMAPGWPERYFSAGDATRSSGLTVEAGRRLFFDRGRLQSEISADPASEAAASLLVLLADRGVTVAGRSATAVAPAPATHRLAAVDSPPLLDLLRHTVQRSDNHLADTIFRMLGRVQGDGSWASGDAATRTALEPLELDWTGATLADGSGLSRDDRLSAGFLTDLDVRMNASNRGGEWRSLLATSGGSGTLRRRLLGTVAQGRLHGKTGSLRDVRSLSGFVVGPDGERVHFAVIGHELVGEEVAAVRRLQDEVVLVLAEELYGCERVPVAPATPLEESAANEPPPPVETKLVCAS